MLEQIQQKLGETMSVGRNLIVLEEVGSTNDYAKELACQGAADGTVVLAEYQSAGRGRRGRTFQSSGGKGIYMTVLLRPDLPAERLMPVTALAGVAVCDAVERVCGVRPGLKWPNDPVVCGKKAGGILTEMTVDGETGMPCLILGIGINVRQEESDFSPDVAQMAGSLEQLLRVPVQKPALIAALIGALDEMYRALKTGDVSAYLAAYRRDCVNLGKTVQIIRGQKRETAQALAVDDRFRLVVRYENGEEATVSSGEVSVRGLYGYVE